MTKGILGRKVGMTQIYAEDGKVIPVTVIQAGPCHVLQVKTVDRDGYEAVQLGFVDKPRPQGNRKRASQATRAERGHVAAISSKRSKIRQASGVEAVAKADCEPKRFVRELRGSAEGYEVGQQVGVDLLGDVAAVDIIGTSKGRGYAGVMKRHNYSGQRASHGVKKCHRHPGSTGQSASPSRTVKGRRMAGRYGGGRSTMRNVKVVRVDVDNHLLLVRGAVPGPAGGLVLVPQTNKVG